MPPPYWTTLERNGTKDEEAIVVGMESIRYALPCKWLSAHPDTGSEFINWQVKGWCDTEGITMSRSEPGKSNDNMYVEGSGTDTWCGSISGIAGSTVGRCSSHESILEGCRFVSKTTSKRYVDRLRKIRVGAKYVRKYEKVARTPYQRMLDHSAVDETVKEELRRRAYYSDPLLLKREMNTLLTVVNQQQTRHDHRLCNFQFSLTVIYGLERPLSFMGEGSG